MGNFEIPELKTVLEKLETIEKLQLENGMPTYLTKEKAAEKYGISPQTLESAAKLKFINKYIFKRRIYFSPKEIDKAIYDGMVKPFNPKQLKT